jgi:hypothetical protein
MNYPPLKTVGVGFFMTLVGDFQEINYPNKRTTEAQRTQRENFCVSFGTFFYLEVPRVLVKIKILEFSFAKPKLAQEIIL